MPLLPRWVDVRGRVLAVGVLAAGVVTAPAGPLPDPGDAPQPSARTVTLEAPSVRSLASGAAPVDRAGSDGWLELAPIDAGDAVLVGADWGGAPDVEVEVRSHDGEGWTAWQPFVLDHEHAPDADAAEAVRHDATASDPVWIGRSTRLQLRTRGPAADVELDLVDIDGDLAWTPPALRAPTPGAALAATEQPPILSRASWGADESLRKHAPREWNRANFAIVHHTAGSNDYAPHEADDVIRAIYAYHLRRGWDDIAYNFLVDIHGRIWEGRAGGIDRPVVGGHASGFNGGSVGVSAIGSFQVTEPPVAMVDAIRDLLAWKLDWHHLDPHGETEEIAGGGSSNRFPAGDRVTLPNIIGHRHTNKTTCPGDKLYEHVVGLHGDVSFADRVDEVGHPKAYGGPPLDREQPLHGIRPRWDVEFTSPVTWQLAIVDEAGNEVRRGTASASEHLHLAWDLRDRSGSLVAPGTYFAQLDALDATGAPITPVTTRFEVTPAAERISGTSRVATSVELSRWAFDEAEKVVLASAEAFPDALVAGPLAGSFDAPILLVPGSGLPDEVAEEIDRLGATRAYVVGGTGRIPASVEQQLKDRTGVTSVTRYAGRDRFETSARVARVMIEREHPTEGLLALGLHDDPSRAFPDALSAGAFGADQEAPVLLVAPDELPGPILEVLSSRPWKEGLVAFGGPGALKPNVVDHAAEAAGAYASRGKDRVEPAPVLRFAGTDRFDTARLAAEELLRRWEEKLAEDGPSPYAEPTGLEVVLASGRNWPDALGASAAAKERGAVFLLVDDLAMERSEAARRFLREHAADAAHAVVSGGPKAVAEQVVLAVAEEVRSAGPSTQPREPWPGERPGALGFPFPLPTPGPSPSPSATPEPEPSPSPSPSPSASPTADPSASPSASASASASPSPSASGSPSPSPSPSSSPSPSPSPAATASGGELTATSGRRD